MNNMEKVFYFGIRHLSPNGAFQLLKYLEEVKPTAVLVEGPQDANDLIDHIIAKTTQPPIAVLAYTTQLPVKTVLYPFAIYSPEYQALKWAIDNNVHCEFIDIPTSVTLGFTDYQNEEIGVTEQIYERWALVAGESDHETYWERNFEHNLNKDAYRLSTIEFGKSLRLLSNAQNDKLNTLREAFMKRQIELASQKYERIVVVTGAFHTTALQSDECLPLNDKEYNNIPRCESSLTLMPYSYLRLSSRSGYGAGNYAPYYYEMLWDAINKNDLSFLSYNYMASLTHYLRQEGFIKSSAEVIEAIRLANALAYLHESNVPSLFDLHDGATVALGHGEFGGIAQAVAKVEVGTKIGSLPIGISRTSIQDDFYRELKRLNLERFKTNIAQTLELDLRENRRVKSQEAAYLDLNRSFFLHRLDILGISFAQPVKVNQETATWAERWILQWREEAEIELVEAVLLGDTIELASSYVLKEKLDNCHKVNEAAQIIRISSQSGLMETMEYALSVLQSLTTDSGQFVDVCEAAMELSLVINFKDIRKYDSQYFIPILSQLFLRGTLLMLDASNCDNKTANDVIDSISILNKISLEHTSEIDEDLFLKQLHEISNRDDKNPKVSGFCCAILLERGEINIENLSMEISRRLSPGIDADLGTGWFEGLSLKNRYVILSNLELWEHIDNYISSLDNEQFKRALVFLRRAFGSFNKLEKNNIAQNLGQLWKDGSSEENISYELTNKEKEELSDLSDFDFGDL